jgi:hypothetical protein
MRDDIVLTSTARRLRQAGLAWFAQPGDWCTLLDGAHLSEDSSGLWLVTEADPQVGWVTVMSVGTNWPPARIAMVDALWLPTIGQLKSYLRGRGFRVNTTEGEMRPTGVASSGPRRGWAAALLKQDTPPTTGDLMLVHPHICTATRPTEKIYIESSGATESEATAEVVHRILMGGQ